jgi:hypothetical protein
MVSSAAKPPVYWPQLYLGVFFTTLATLLLELSLTRIFSVVFYYHFAFLAISVALFGLGIGGVVAYVQKSDAPLFRRLGRLSIANAIAVIIFVPLVLSRSGGLSASTLIFVYLASAVPFFLAGMTVSLAISESIERVATVYFFDLLGAATGCLLLIPFLDLMGGPNTVICAGAIFAIAGSFWFNLGGSNRGRVVAVAVALALTALIVINAKTRIFDLKFAKGEQLSEEIFVKWNSFSRVAVRPDNIVPHWFRIVIDADAATGIAPYDWNHLGASDRKDLEQQGPGFPYLVRPGAKTLIIGAGGGWDVARALSSGSKDITGVEINNIIANDIMRNRFRKESHDLYLRPEVRIFVEDGRSFVRRSDEKYQVLQMTLVDTWASTAAGAFALTENNLYTVEAFRDYLEHLTPDGFLCFTRWGFEPPRESLRLLSLAMESLGQLGENQPARHIVVVRENLQNLTGWGAQDTVLVSRKPFGDGDVERIRTILAGSKFQKLYLPGDQPLNDFAKLLTTSDRAGFLANYRYDVSPVTDNRPFFFYTVQPRDLWNFILNLNENADVKINLAVPMLYALVGISVFATFVILVLPRFLLGSRLPQDRRVFGFLWYFVFLGAGYILVQVALIQRFVLFLGHPTYALTVIVFSMLVASGLGSFFSRRWIGTAESRLLAALAAVFVFVLAIAFIAAPLTRSGVGLPFPMKVLLTVIGVAPAAFFMGMPFPSGLTRLEAMHHESVRWAWSLNAAASVLGSACAIFFALYLGLQITLLIGGLCYVGAILAVRLTRSSAVA